MDRREALNKLPELSAGCLDAQTEAQVRRWVEDCPHCKAEWHSLQQFLSRIESVPPVGPSPEQSRQMWSRCNEALFDKIEARRLQQQKPTLGLWMKSQPRWGWAMLGGAVAILGAAILAPDSAPSTSSTTIARAPSTSGVDNPGVLQPLGRPPLFAATMVDHHAQMAADPFADRVGSSLVSFSASYPVSPEGASR